MRLDNPLLEVSDGIAVDVSSALRSVSTSYGKATGDRRREFRRLTKKESAREAIAGLDPSTDIFGFTRGQFSLIELLEAVLEQTGPASIFLSTWTAAAADLDDVLKFLQSGKIVGAKFLLDFSFQRRQPEVAQSIRDRFGLESVRVTKNHAKFFLVENKQWTITCKTSMNLNTNPRFEDFDLSNDQQLFAFMRTIADEIFKKHHAGHQSTGTSQSHWSEWKRLSL